MAFMIDLTDQRFQKEILSECDAMMLFAPADAMVAIQVISDLL